MAETDMTEIANGSREAFESVVRMEAGFVPLDLSNSNGRYWNESINQRWQAWQSALAWADSKNSAAMETACDGCSGATFVCRKCGHSYGLAWYAVKDARKTREYNLLVQENRSQAAWIADLERALRPFARWGRGFGPYGREDSWVIATTPTGKVLTMGDIRDAVRVLGEPVSLLREPVHIEVPDKPSPIVNKPRGMA